MRCEDPWDSLVSQATVIDELLASEKPCHTEADGILKENAKARLHSLDAYTCVHTYQYTGRYTHKKQTNRG